MLTASVLSVLLGLLAPFCKSQEDDEPRKCHHPHELYQFAIVLDRTDESVLNWAKTRTSEVLQQLKSQFPLSEFALTAFGDYDRESWTGEGRKRRSLHDDKYVKTIFALINYLL